jgi:hypothetical protein
VTHNSAMHQNFEYHKKMMERKKGLTCFTRHPEMEFESSLINNFETASSKECPIIVLISSNLPIVLVKLPLLNKRPRLPRALETTLAGWNGIE